MSLSSGLSETDAGRIRVLDDRASCLFKIIDEGPRGVRVNVVVERHFLARQHLRVGYTAMHRHTKECRHLMRILAVPEARNLADGPSALIRQLAFEFLNGKLFRNISRNTRAWTSDRRNPTCPHRRQGLSI